MSYVKHAVIAAAGLGSRLGFGMPKCLVQINGKSILEWQLHLLKNIENIRVVVGFQEADVIAEARRHRNDITFVRNPAFRSNTTLDSYKMGSRFIKESCLYMDADIIFEPQSFNTFLTSCSQQEFLIGVTKAKTEDAVFVDVNNGFAKRFSRKDKSPLEWANLLWVNPSLLNTDGGSVYEHLSTMLPIPCHEIESFEVDRSSDLENALQAVSQWE